MNENENESKGTMKNKEEEEEEDDNADSNNDSDIHNEFQRMYGQQNNNNGSKRSSNDNSSGKINDNITSNSNANAYANANANGRTDDGGNGSDNGKSRSKTIRYNNKHVMTANTMMNKGLNSSNRTTEYTPRDPLIKTKHKKVGLGYGAKQLSNHQEKKSNSYISRQQMMKQKLQQLQQDNSNRPNEYNPIIPTNQLQQPQQPSPTQTQTTPTTIGVQFGKKEETIRSKAKRTKLKILSIFIKSNIASILVFIFYLITLETILSCLLTVGLMLYWYFYALGLFGTVPDGWSGGGIDWVVLGFAVVTPITVSIGMAFTRRERALFQISQVRSFSFQIYLAHAIWDWDSGNGRSKLAATNHTTHGHTNNGNSENENINWLDHTDQVLEHLVSIGDELSRFLTLPTSSRSYQRMLKSGRKEAADIVELQYKLFDSFYTKRITKITTLTEKLKSLGLSSTEASRLRQYERYIGEAVEGLRMIKMYRTPQALRCFGRMFTILLPPLYAASFSQLAFDLHSLTMGILFALITPLCLTALFESMQKLEDPFVGWITLDGVDVAEELEILHWHQLKNARFEVFPNAQPFVMKHDDDATLSGMMLTPRLEGGIFDLSFLQEGGSTHHPRTEIDRDASSRKSHYAMDGSTRLSHFGRNGSSKSTKKIGGDELGLDGSERVSHYAMDASNRSRKYPSSKRINNARYE